MHPSFVDLTGQTFHYLTVKKYLGQKNNKSLWLCACQCGSETKVSRDKLITGDTKSCGCYAKELPHSQLAHGRSRSAEYNIWRGAKTRCYNPRYAFFKQYGGRGITMSEKWKNDFSAFYADVGARPSAKHTLDRINNDRGYEPGNVRWVTQKQQCRNKSTSLMVTIGSDTKCVSEWCEIYGVKPATAYSRISQGISPDEAVSRAAALR